MRIDDERYYNLQKALTYNPSILMIIGAAGKGKTYTTRGYCLKQAIKNNNLFVEVCRTKTERDEVRVGYFDKLALDPDFSKYEFDCRRNIFYCRLFTNEDEKKKPKWKRVGYITSLTEVQTTKKRTFANATNIIFDESIIETIDSHHNYLPNEWNLLSRVINSCVREDTNNEERVKPRLFLLGNAVDLLNPYFQVFGINKEPKYGYSWHGGKQMLLHYVPADEYDEKRRTETLAGYMASLSGYDKTSFGNAFDIDLRYIAKKPPRAKPYIGLKFEGHTFGVWLDMSEGYYYITDDIPNVDNITVFSLTRADDTPNIIAARAGLKPMEMLRDMYYLGSVLFENVSIRENFLRAMRMFGIR